ncbi:hypothetical protein [Streptomyces sp.]|uniref:hypothetical protein n=1 Tax=Streptomyces sp. TaxID=1931 RepID=UPI002F9237EA
MTTAAAPVEITVTDAELALWLKGEIEKPCELNHWLIPCAHPAAWAGYFRFPCGHLDPQARLVCDLCHTNLVEGRAFCSPPCRVPATVTWAERLHEGGSR